MLGVSALLHHIYYMIHELMYHFCLECRALAADEDVEQRKRTIVNADTYVWYALVSIVTLYKPYAYRTNPSHFRKLLSPSFAAKISLDRETNATMTRLTKTGLILIPILPMVLATVMRMVVRQIRQHVVQMALVAIKKSHDISMRRSFLFFKVKMSFCDCSVVANS